MVHPGITRFGEDELGLCPHIDPDLRFDIRHSSIEGLIDEAIASGDVNRMGDALSELKRTPGALFGLDREG